ncbi:MAG: hypothetical protein ACNI25_02935 [Halarcobacter sp.]
MKTKKQSSNFDSSIFFKRNMRINKNLPIVYATTLLISLVVIFIGNN